MIIIPATTYDLDGIYACAAKFFEYAKFAEQGLTLDEYSFKHAVRKYIEDESGIVLLLKENPYGEVKGGIAGQVMPYWMNRNINLLVEVFYWINPECRGSSGIRMLKEFENEGRRLGANKVVMISVETHLTDKVNALYKRCGYMPFENFFIKDV